MKDEHKPPFETQDSFDPPPPPDDSAITDEGQTPSDINSPTGKRLSRVRNLTYQQKCVQVSLRALMIQAENDLIQLNYIKDLITSFGLNYPHETNKMAKHANNQILQKKSNSVYFKWYIK